MACTNYQHIPALSHYLKQDVSSTLRLSKDRLGIDCFAANGHHESTKKILMSDFFRTGGNFMLVKGWSNANMILCSVLFEYTIVNVMAMAHLLMSLVYDPVEDLTQQHG